MRQFRRLGAALALGLGCLLSSADARGEGPSKAWESLRRHVGAAVAAHEKIQDYTCTLLKQERIAGKLTPEQSAHLSVMEKPFSILLKFTGPRELHGQEVCYVQGKNNNQMRVKGGGLKGAVGFVSLNVTDTRVMAQSRHAITEAGLGQMIQNLAKLVAEESAAETRVTATSVEWKERKCVRYEVVHPERSKAPFARTVVYFDEETSLPVRLEGYDAPRDGEAVGELLEAYSFVGLKVNVGLTAELFKK